MRAARGCQHSLLDRAAGHLAGDVLWEAIIDAIHHAKVMVLVFSSNANVSAHIPKEVERAVSNGVAILPFRIEDVAPGKSLDYFIGSVHWLDAMTPPMERHLDDLAATVRKLLPVKSGEHGAPAVLGSGVWQSTPVAVPSTASAAVMRPATEAGAGAGAAQASNSKMIWVGAALVAVLAAVVLTVMLFRGRGGPQAGADVPSVTNPGGSADARSDSSPVAKAAVEAGADPIVGCYQWFNSAPVVIRANDTMVAGPFTARWRRVNAATHEYTFTWPEATDTVTISPDQQSLRGSNQYGYPTSGTRITGGGGLVGTWRWPNGVPVIVEAGGAFSAATFRGRWRAVDAARGIYTLTWPNPVDSVTLNGSRISGANQYGVAISGVAQPCAGN